MLTGNSSQNQDNNLDQEFNALEFELRHAKDFQLLEQAQTIQYNDNYYSGDYDAKIGVESTFSQCLSNDYRTGYLTAIEEKYNDKFGLLE